MKLLEFLKLLKYYTVVHIGTKDGEGWVYSGEVERVLAVAKPEHLNRDIDDLYIHNGRDESDRYIGLTPGIAIIIEGKEDGGI